MFGFPFSSLVFFTPLRTMGVYFFSLPIAAAEPLLENEQAKPKAPSFAQCVVARLQAKALSAGHINQLRL